MKKPEWTSGQHNSLADEQSTEVAGGKKGNEEGEEREEEEGKSFLEDKNLIGIPE